MLNNLLKNQKKSQKQQEKSRGRSMVEMLGVLAIIGVLSIGGIAGYTLAMRKYRANEIVSLMTKYAIIGYTSFQNYIQNNEIDIYYNNSNWPPYYTYNGAFGNCSSNYCGIPSFGNASLGGFPKGVTRIFLYRIYSATDINGSSAFYDDRGIPVSDYVSLAVDFDDKELCKATLSILSGYADLYGSDKADRLECDSGTIVRDLPVN